MTTSSSSDPVGEGTLPFRETLIEQAQLSECDRINLNFLGSIQGNTANVVFISYPDGEVIGVDANFKQLGFMQMVDRNDPLVGNLVQKYFPQAIHSKVMTAIQEMIQKSLLREFVFLWHDDVFYSLCVSTNVVGDYSIVGIEIETLDELEMLDITSANESLGNALHQVSRALDACTQAHHAAAVACKAIFDMLGYYDRGMVYYFHHDLSGEVIYEIKKDSIESSYMGMHFPHSDIPQSARLLYAKNVVRYIANVDGDEVPLVSNKKRIDLTQTRSRAVHKCHLLYCRNMGIKCCLSLAILTGKGDLWGYVL